MTAVIAGIATEHRAERRCHNRTANLPAPARRLPARLVAFSAPPSLS